MHVELGACFASQEVPVRIGVSLYNMSGRKHVSALRSSMVSDIPSGTLRPSQGKVEMSRRKWETLFVTSLNEL